MLGASSRTGAEPGVDPDRYRLWDAQGEVSPRQLPPLATGGLADPDHTGLICEQFAHLGRTEIPEFA
jgi:hypothetical protein